MRVRAICVRNGVEWAVNLMRLGDPGIGPGGFGSRDRLCYKPSAPPGSLPSRPVPALTNPIFCAVDRPDLKGTPALAAPQAWTYSCGLDVAPVMPIPALLDIMVVRRSFWSMRKAGVIAVLAVLIGLAFMFSRPVDAKPCHLDGHTMPSDGGYSLMLESGLAADDSPNDSSEHGKAQGYSCCHVAAPFAPIVASALGPRHVCFAGMQYLSDCSAGPPVITDIYRPPALS